jgi:hypothetical protein
MCRVCPVRKVLLIANMTVLATSSLAYFWRKVPETKGRSLQEIEHELTGSKAWHRAPPQPDG